MAFSLSSIDTATPATVGVDIPVGTGIPPSVQGAPDTTSSTPTLSPAGPLPAGGSSSCGDAARHSDDCAIRRGGQIVQRASRLAMTGMMIAAATRWVAISRTFVDTSASTSSGGIIDSAVSVTVIRRNHTTGRADRRRRMAAMPTPISAEISVT